MLKGVKAKKYQHQYYLDHKTEFLDRVKKRRVEFRKIVADTLKDKCCKHCQESDERCLEFHHVRGKKLLGIAEVSNFSSAKKLREEIAKCEIVCSNCHKKIHLPLSSTG